MLTDVLSCLHRDAVGNKVSYMCTLESYLNNTCMCLLGKLGSQMNAVCVAFMSNTSLLTNNEFKGLEQKQLYWERGSGDEKGEYGINFAKSVIHKSSLLNYVITLSCFLPFSILSPTALPHLPLMFHLLVLLVLLDMVHSICKPALLLWFWVDNEVFSHHSAS